MCLIMLPEDRARHEAAESERSRVGKLARHEEEIRRLERERAARRLLPTMPTELHAPVDEFYTRVSY